YALYDLATLLYHFLNDKQNGEKYYRQLLAEYPDDPLAEVAASVLGQSVDPPIEEKLAKASTLPTEYELLQNYPNPFNPETRIQFTLPEAAQVRIEVMNVLGQRIAVLCDGSMAAGYHTVRWDGRTLSVEKASSGVYFCRMQAGGFIKTIKMMLLP
ncbi:T9SS type A sorting domain-containing protein, partial [bacterium]|nr:T9SS type A sorting domain-containing protein [bacterium]